MDRRRWILAATGTLLGIRSLGRGKAAGAAEVANLQSQLESELFARRPAEFAFIAKVVQKVEEDELPYSLVYSTFLYARKQRPYPFVYFARAMRVRAAALGVSLD